MFVVMLCLLFLRSSFPSRRGRKPLRSLGTISSRSGKIYVGGKSRQISREITMIRNAVRSYVCVAYLLVLRRLTMQCTSWDVDFLQRSGEYWEFSCSWGDVKIVLCESVLRNRVCLNSRYQKDKLFHLGSTKYGRRGIAITYKAETSQMLLNYKMWKIPCSTAPMLDMLGKYHEVSYEIPAIKKRTLMISGVFIVKWMWKGSLLSNS